MNGALVFAIVAVGGLILLGLVIVFADRTGGSSARRAELAKVKQQRDLAYQAIEDVSTALEEYKEIDHPLASKLAPLISKFKKEEWELRK